MTSHLLLINFARYVQVYYDGGIYIYIIVDIQIICTKPMSSYVKDVRLIRYKPKPKAKPLKPSRMITQTPYDPTLTHRGPSKD